MNAVLSSLENTGFFQLVAGEAVSKINRSCCGEVEASANHADVNYRQEVFG